MRKRKTVLYKNKNRGLSEIDWKKKSAKAEVDQAEKIWTKKRNFKFPESKKKTVEKARRVIDRTFTRTWRAKA